VEEALRSAATCKIENDVTPEEQNKLNELCERIAVEKNPDVFDQLVKELNDLLDVKHKRIRPESKKSEDHGVIDPRDPTRVA
jgi:hypothetical protein